MRFAGWWLDRVRTCVLSRCRGWMPMGGGTSSNDPVMLLRRIPGRPWRRSWWGGWSRPTVGAKCGSAQTGRVRSASAAVVVNDRSMTEGVGKLEHVVWKPRSAEEMHRLEELAQAAVGYDARRGDQVVMQNVSFSTNAPAVKPPVMDRLMEEMRGLLHTQPGLMRTAVIRTFGAGLGAFVVRAGANEG